MATLRRGAAANSQREVREGPEGVGRAEERGPAGNTKSLPRISEVPISHPFFFPRRLPSLPFPFLPPSLHPSLPYGPTHGLPRGPLRRREVFGPRGEVLQVEAEVERLRDVVAQVAVESNV